MILLSFVIPCYRSEKTIRKVIDEIRSTVAQRKEYDYEIIAVNDYSPDRVYDVLVELAKEDTKIKVINFARNMGKHSAVMAGYAVCKGEYIVNLDDDFQCPVYELWKLIDPLVNDECDVTTAVYKKKKESAFKRFGSRVDSWMTDLLLDKPKGLRLENLSAMQRYVCQEIVNYKNPYPYLEGLIYRVTKRIKGIVMDERCRADENASGFTFKKSLHLFVNGLTAFSVKPLRIASVFGCLFAFVGFIFGIITVIRKILNPSIVMGYSSLMAVFLFSMGLIMLILGLIGEYLGRIYICINESPQYIIKNTINLDN